MFCKIADLLVSVPEAGGMASRCGAYLTEENGPVDIVLRADKYRPEKYPHLDEDGVAYMESGAQFNHYLLAFEGIYLHSSAVALGERAYLFSGPCGTGKSTHTRLWQQTFGSAAQVFNDDKPALRRIDGTWYAYGTPWCGKDGININMKVPLAGICFLKQGQENRIRRLKPAEAAQRIISQTHRRFNIVGNLDLMLRRVQTLVTEIPVFELENRPEPAAAHMSYEMMLRAAEEAGL